MKKKKPDNLIRKFLVIILLVIISVVLYSHFIGAKGLMIKEYPIINNKLNDNFHGLKIVHFSDLHYGSTVNIDDLKKLVKEINNLKPEIIIFTGDLLDNKYNISKDELNSVIKELKKLDSVISSYLIKGNVDKGNNYEMFLNNTNMTLLNDELELFYYNDNIPIQIVALDKNIENAFSNYNDELYTILITHKPDNVKKLGDYKPDLILAGHSHNSQIRLPIIGAIHKIEGSITYYEEKHIVSDIEMYISGGIGTSVYPFRLFNKPSFNFYRLYNK